MDKHETIARVSELSGLDPITVEDLFVQGWTFVEELAKPLLWVAPGNPTKFHTAEENCGN